RRVGDPGGHLFASLAVRRAGGAQASTSHGRAGGTPARTGGGADRRGAHHRVEPVTGVAGGGSPGRGARRAGARPPPRGSPGRGAVPAAASASRRPSRIWARLAPQGTTTRPSALLTRSSSRQHLVITGTGPGGPARAARLRGHMSTVGTPPP